MTRSSVRPPSPSSVTTSRTSRCAWPRARDARRERLPPRSCERLDIDDLCEPPEIAGPGFINLRLKTDVLAGAVNDLLADPHSGIVQTDRAAKGGDRLLRAERRQADARRSPADHDHRRLLQPGADRASGTRSSRRTTSATGAPSSACSSRRPSTRASTRPQLTLPEAENLYKRGSKHFREDEEFAARARRRVVALQSGDEQTRSIWRAAGQRLPGRLQRHVRPAQREADRRRPGRGVDLQRRPRLRRRRARGRAARR